MPIEGWGVAEMEELGSRHAELEARGELEPLLATLDDDPVYEYLPLGLGMRGSEIVRRFYTQFVDHFLPLRQEVELLGQWVNETSVVQEYVLSFAEGPAAGRHHVLGILYVDEQSARKGRLKGERVYASEAFIRLMTGAVFEDLEPIG